MPRNPFRAALLSALLLAGCGGGEDGPKFEPKHHPELRQADQEIVREVELLGGAVVTEGDQVVELELIGVEQVPAGLVADAAKFSSLRALRLAGSGADDSAMPHIAKLEKLQTLDVSGTGVTGAGLRQLADHPNLELLIIRGANVQESVKRELREQNRDLLITGP